MLLVFYAITLSWMIKHEKVSSFCLLDFLHNCWQHCVFFAVGAFFFPSLAVPKCEAQFELWASHLLGKSSIYNLTHSPSLL
jgi:hypothetical protein